MNKILNLPTLSIVIPMFNEQENVLPLIVRIDKILTKLNVSNEIIMVDDGSTDQTWNNIQSACHIFTNIKAIRFSRNFGHQYAIFAGLKQAQGQAIVSMDGDLQHPPEIIESLFVAWQNGARIVNTVRQDHEVTGPVKRYFSKLFYRMFSVLSEVSISQGSSDFRLIDRKVLEEIISFGDVDVFLRGAIEWVGFKTETIVFKPEKRHEGQTKFTIPRMLKLAGGAIVSYSTVPLKIGVWLGIVTSIFSFIELAYIFYMYFKGETVPGWASTVSVITLLFGVLFLNIGVIGIYLARIHKSLQRRPPYIISETYSLNTQDEAQKRIS